MFDFSLADGIVLLLIPIAAFSGWRTGFKSGLWSTILALRDEGLLANHAEKELGIQHVPRETK